MNCKACEIGLMGLLADQSACRGLAEGFERLACVSCGDVFDRAVDVSPADEAPDPAGATKESGEAAPVEAPAPAPAPAESASGRGEDAAGESVEGSRGSAAPRPEPDVEKGSTGNRFKNVVKKAAKKGRK